MAISHKRITKSLEDGFTPQEINDLIAEEMPSFNIADAREQGFSEDEILDSVREHIAPKSFTQQIVESPLARIPALAATGGVSGRLGILGDIAQLFGTAGEATALGAAKVGGLPTEGADFSQAFTPSVLAEDVQDPFFTGDIPEIGDIRGFPGTRDISDFIQGITGIKPETPVERGVSRIAEFAGGGPTKQKALVQAVAAGAAGQAAEELGAGPGGQLVATIVGASLPASLKGATRVIKGQKAPIKSFVDGLYANSDELAVGLRADGKVLAKELKDIIKQTRKGVGSPSKTTLRESAKRLLGKIKTNGLISAEELVESKKDINELRGDPLLATAGRRRLDKLFKVVNNAIDTMESAGGKSEQFVKSLREADKAFAGVQSNNFITKLLNKKRLDVANLSPAALLFFGVPSASLAPKVGAGLLVFKTAQIANRLATNPGLRKFYQKVLTATAKNNAGAAIKAINRFDREVKHLGIQEDELLGSVEKG